MFTSQRLVPLVLNTRLTDIPASYVGPRPSSTFQPVGVTTYFQILADTLLGQSHQAKAFTACTLLSICDRSLLSQLLQRGNADSRPEYLELLRMRDMTFIRSEDTQGVIHTTQPAISATEYTLYRFQLDRLSSTTYRLTRNNGGNEVLSKTEAGFYGFRAGDDPDIQILFKPTIDNFAVHWAAMPESSIVEQFNALANSQWAVMELLYNHEHHTLDSRVRKALYTILRSRASAMLRPCAFLLLLLSHYDALHNMRGLQRAAS